jgi:hypothetical protein
VKRSARAISLALAGVGAAWCAPFVAWAEAAAPGTLSSIEPRGGSVGTPSLMWRITFASTTASGAADEVSGVVVVPADPRRRTGRVVSFGVGTQGLADACAPSRTIASGGLLEAPEIGAMVARGWSVVVSDGEGLGTPGAATYAVGSSAGHAMLDIVRAARAIPEAGLPERGPVGLFGYSSGGGAVAWAAQAQPSYAPDVPLVGAMAGGSVVDVAAYVRRGLRSGATAAALDALLGFQAAFPELRLAPLLTPRGRLAQRVAASTCIYPAIAAISVLGTRGLLRADPFDAPDWAARAERERPGRAAPAAPTLLFHGARDEAVPVAGAERLRRDWCALGARLDWRRVASDHVGTMLAGDAFALRWLAQRFSGSPALSNCPTT